MIRHVQRSFAVLGLVLLAMSLSGCIVETGRPGGGYCYWHPYACR